MPETVLAGGPRAARCNRACVDRVTLRALMDGTDRPRRHGGLMTLLLVLALRADARRGDRDLARSPGAVQSRLDRHQRRRCSRTRRSAPRSPTRSSTQLFAQGRRRPAAVLGAGPARPGRRAPAALARDPAGGHHASDQAGQARVARGQQPGPPPARRRHRARPRPRRLPAADADRQPVARRAGERARRSRRSRRRCVDLLSTSRSATPAGSGSCAPTRSARSASRSTRSATWCSSCRCWRPSASCWRSRSRPASACVRSPTSASAWPSAGACCWRRGR